MFPPTDSFLKNQQLQLLWFYRLCCTKRGLNDGISRWVFLYWLMETPVLILYTTDLWAVVLVYIICEYLNVKYFVRFIDLVFYSLLISLTKPFTFVKSKSEINKSSRTIMKFVCSKPLRIIDSFTLVLETRLRLLDSQ